MLKISILFLFFSKMAISGAKFCILYFCISGRAFFDNLKFREGNCLLFSYYAQRCEHNNSLL